MKHNERDERIEACKTNGRNMKAITLVTATRYGRTYDRGS